MNLKEWRAREGLNMTKAAERLALSQPTISRIEAGEQWPDPATIEKIIKKSGGLVTAPELTEAFMIARSARESAA